MRTNIVFNSMSIEDKKLNESLISTRNGLITDIAIKMLSNKRNTISL